MSSIKDGIHNAIPIVAAAYAERFNVNVIFVDKNTASTDGKTIYLPYLDSLAMDPDISWGYLAHEAGHIKFTEMTCLNDVGSQFERSLLNALEDCRIERAMADRYPGTIYTLTTLDKYLIVSGGYELERLTSPGTQVIFTCLFWGMYHVVGKEIFKPLLDKALVLLVDGLGQTLVDQILGLLRGLLPGARNTYEVVVLTLNIADLLKSEASSQGDPKSDLQVAVSLSPSSNQDSQESQSVVASEGADDSIGRSSSGNAQADGESKSLANYSDNQPQQSGATSDGASDKDGIDTKFCDDVLTSAQFAASALDSTSRDLPQDRASQVASALLQVAQRGSFDYIYAGKPREAIVNQKAGQVIHEESMRVGSRLQHGLYGLVQAQSKMASRTKRTGKQIDANRVLRVMSGDTRVFKSKSQKISPNTAVHILLDASSSMDGERIQVARSASYALSYALGMIKGVNPAVSAFGQFGSPHCIIEVLKHGQKVVSRKGAFYLLPNGDTPLTKALIHAAGQLIRQKEERKIILCLTDGKPTHTARAIEHIQACEKSGIDVFGIGIQTNATKNIFSRQVVINNLGDLPSKMFELIGNELLSSLAA